MIRPIRSIPTAKILTSLWAPAKSPGEQFTDVNNFATNASIGGDNDQYNARIDQSVSEKQRILAAIPDWSNLSLSIDPYRTQTYIDRGPESFHTHQLVVADTYPFTPTTIGDFRVAFLRFVYRPHPREPRRRPHDLGWPASLNNQVTFRHIPTPCVQGFTDVFCTNGTGSTIVARNDSYPVAPSLHQIVGRHTIKFGGEWRRMTHNFARATTRAAFSTSITSSPR